jgi:hypothetical protein
VEPSRVANEFVDRVVRPLVRGCGSLISVHVLAIHLVERQMPLKRQVDCELCVVWCHLVTPRSLTRCCRITRSILVGLVPGCPRRAWFLVCAGAQAVAELLGTGMLVTVVVGSGIAAQRLSPDDVGRQLLENATATFLGDSKSPVATDHAFGRVDRCRRAWRDECAPTAPLTQIRPGGIGLPC